MTRTELERMEIEQLKEMASIMGVKHHHKVGKDKLLKMLDSKTEDFALENEVKLEEVQVAPSEELKTEEVTPVAPVTAVQKFDPLVKPVSKDVYPTIDEVKEALKSHFARGLTIVTMDDVYWHFKVSNREASGNMKMPLGQFVLQANILLQPTRTPTEE